MSRKRKPKKTKAASEPRSVAIGSQVSSNSVTSPKGSASNPSRPHGLTILLSILAIVISAVSLANSLYVTSQNRKFQRAHVRPDVRTVVRHSSRQEQAHNAKAPEIVIWNEGPITAVAVSTTYSVYVIDPEKFTVSAVLGIAEELSEYNVLIPELAVGQKIGKEILGASPLAVFFVSTEYYRESDMERFTRHDYFLFDSDKYYDFDGFRSHPNFEKLMQVVNRTQSKNGASP